jgi:hypothetical protein
MPTGVYIFDDAAILSISKRGIHTSIGISLNTAFDLMTVPVGGSIGLGSSIYFSEMRILDNLEATRQNPNRYCHFGSTRNMLKE